MLWNFAVFRQSHLYWECMKKALKYIIWVHDITGSKFQTENLRSRNKYKVISYAAIKNNEISGSFWKNARSKGDIPKLRFRTVSIPPFFSNPLNYHITSHTSMLYFIRLNFPFDLAKVHICLKSSLKGSQSNLVYEILTRLAKENTQLKVWKSHGVSFGLSLSAVEPTTFVIASL